MKKIANIAHLKKEMVMQLQKNSASETAMARTLYERASSVSQQDDKFGFSGNMTQADIRAKLDMLAEMAEAEAHS